MTDSPVSVHSLNHLNGDVWTSRKVWKVRRWHTLPPERGADTSSFGTTLTIFVSSQTFVSFPAGHPLWSEGRQISESIWSDEVSFLSFVLSRDGYAMLSSHPRVGRRWGRGRGHLSATLLLRDAPLKPRLPQLKSGLDHPPGDGCSTWAYGHLVGRNTAPSLLSSWSHPQERMPCSTLWSA